jgi:8-oxo-dGTP pyrophosphatase MutT (NUDIX family)
MVSPAKHNFASKVAPFIAPYVATGTPVCGVSFVPIHVYGVGRAHLQGKPCVVLGKERGGRYKDMLNFFGGKTTDKGTGTNPYDVALALYEEVFEELGIVLTPELFFKSLVKVAPKSCGRHGNTLMFFCHITSINRASWNKQMKARQGVKGLPWKYQEMSEIEHVPIDSIGANVSCFVGSCIASLTEACAGLARKPSVSIHEFATAMPGRE